MHLCCQYFPSDNSYIIPQAVKFLVLSHAQCLVKGVYGYWIHLAG